MGGTRIFALLKEEIVAAAGRGDHVAVVQLVLGESANLVGETWVRRPLVDALRATSEDLTIGDYRALLAVAPKNPFLLAKLAEALERAGFVEEALAHWLDVGKDAPQRMHVVRSVLRCHLLLGDFRKVCELAAEAERQFPLEHFWLRPFGSALEASDLAAARGFYDIQRNHPSARGRGYAFAALCRIAGTEGRWKAALRLCDESESEFGGSHWWAATRSAANRELGIADAPRVTDDVLPDGQSVVVKRSGQRSVREAAALQIAFRAGLKVPALFEPEQLGSAEHGLLVMEKVSGSHLPDVGLTPLQVGDGFRQIGGFLASLHSIDLADKGTFGFDKKPIEPRDHFRRFTESVTISLAGLGEHDVATALRAFCSSVLPSKFGAMVLCHGDLHLHNVLFDVSAAMPDLLAVIDFGAAEVAPAEADVGRALAFVSVRHPAQASSFIAGYRSAGASFDSGVAAAYCCLHMAREYCSAGTAYRRRDPQWLAVLREALADTSTVML